MPNPPIDQAAGKYLLNFVPQFAIIWRDVLTRIIIQEEEPEKQIQIEDAKTEVYRTDL